VVACNAVGAAAWNGYAGGSFEDAAKAGAVAGATSAIYEVVGTATTGADWYVKTAAHAAAGCAVSEMGGSSCRNGAISGAVSKAVTLAGWQFDGYYGTISAAFWGGSTSVLIGGRFWDGAKTAAFAYLFNFCAHNGCFNRRFTLGDAYDQWKNGNGSTVTDVGADELNFNDATWLQSTKDPKTWYISLSMKFESGPIYVTISGRLGENGFFILNPDIYDFDVKELQGRSFDSDLAILKRNFLNAVSATIHGAGTPFKIQFTGLVKAPQPIYDKTFGAVP
jgi:hypothetical protein